MGSVRGTNANPVQCELDEALWEAWLKVQDKVLGNEIELRRRLDRRAKVYDHVPRPLCLAIKASDRRITESEPIRKTRGDRVGWETGHLLRRTGSQGRVFAMASHV